MRVMRAWQPRSSSKGWSNPAADRSSESSITAASRCEGWRPRYTLVAQRCLLRPLGIAFFHARRAFARGVGHDRVNLRMKSDHAHTVRHTDQRGVGQTLLQKRVHGAFGWCIERAGGLVHEQPVRGDEQGAGHGQALLLAGREALHPGIGLLQRGFQIRHAGELQRLADLRGTEVFRALRIGERLFERAQRQIRLLRQEQRTARWRMRVRGVERVGPDTGEPAHQRALAAARRPGEQGVLAAADVLARALQQRPSVGREQQQIAQRHRLARAAQRHHTGRSDRSA